MNSNFENNVLSILSFASTRSTWVSVSSCAAKANVDYDTVYQYFERDAFGQIADFYRYDYRMRVRRDYTRASTLTRFISVVSRGYAY